MRLSFTLTPHDRFIVTATDTERDGSTRILYAEEHDASESLLNVTNAVRKELGYPALVVRSKVAE